MKENARKPGTIPPNKIGVYNSNDHLVGVVGPKATAVTAGRMAKQMGATLGKKDGRSSWTFPK
jgi:hypothetical protein